MQLLLKVLITQTIVWSPLLAHAEYRAFLLEIVDPDDQVIRTVSTTLDHFQYPVYHPLNSNERIRMVKSWMCWERSDHYSPLCEPPEQLPLPRLAPTDDEARIPASDQ